MDTRIGHNGGPALEDGWRCSLEEAQEDPKVQNRPSYLQRYCGPGAPLREIVGVGGPGGIGQWILLRCGHWRDMRDWGLHALRGRKRPTKARCGCCRMKIRPDSKDVAAVERLIRERTKNG